VRVPSLPSALSQGPNNTAEPEIVIEAGSAPVALSTGDYLHLYAAGTPGWVKDGNYTGGFVIMDAEDPSIIVQRSSEHLFVPTMDYVRAPWGGQPPLCRLRALRVPPLPLSLPPSPSHWLLSLVYFHPSTTLCRRLAMAHIQ
jgi:hypothetical protein